MMYHVRTGGLLRCCLATLDEHMQRRIDDVPPQEGDTLKCRYHDDNGGMVFRDGAWEWNRPTDLGGS
jgi:hypothetical protein